MSQKQQIIFLNLKHKVDIDIFNILFIILFPKNSTL